MARFSDSFNRSDGPVGSIPNGGPAWQAVSGVWSIRDSRLYTSASPASNPILVVASGSGDVDESVAVNGYGSDAIYARVQDAGNWVRARSSADLLEDGYSGFKVLLEVSVGGVVTLLGTAHVVASLLRLRAVGDNVQVFVSGGAAPVLSVNNGSFKTVNRHGVGRGGPDSGLAVLLDNYDIDTLNSPPDSPIQVGPVGNAAVDRTRPFLLDWKFSDPDVGDSQSRANVYVKPAASTTWTTYQVLNPNTFLEFEAAALAAGEWDWQVETYDSSGLLGARSATEKFTLGTPPAGPVITSPLDNGVVTASTAAVTWSTTEQDAFEIRRTSDDGLTQYQTSGVVESANTRSYTLDFPVQERFERVEVRTREGGLWSGWTGIRLNVQYTPPTAPVVVVSTDASNARVVVAAIHPAGPTAVTGQTYERRAVGEDVWAELYGSAGLAPGASWSDLFAVPGQRYQYRATAIGDNQTKSVGLPSDPVSVATPKFWLRDPDTGDGRVVHISDFPEIDRPREAVLFEPLDAEFPTVAYGVVRSSRGTFTIKTSDEDEREWLLGRLETGRKLVLVMPPDRDGGRGSVLWFAPLRQPVRRLFAGRSPARLVQVQFVEVTPR